MRVQKSQSTEKPAEWDTTSSAVVVYHNTDITEQEASGDVPRMYNYTQEVYTRDEYNQHLAAENAARISYAEAAILALMDRGVQ